MAGNQKYLGLGEWMDERTDGWMDGWIANMVSALVEFSFCEEDYELKNHVKQ